MSLCNLPFRASRACDLFLSNRSWQRRRPIPMIMFCYIWPLSKAGGAVFSWSRRSKQTCCKWPMERGTWQRIKVASRPRDQLLLTARKWNSHSYSFRRWILSTPEGAGMCTSTFFQLSLWWDCSSSYSALLPNGTKSRGPSPVCVHFWPTYGNLGTMDVCCLKPLVCGGCLCSNRKPVFHWSQLSSPIGSHPTSNTSELLCLEVLRGKKH